MWPTKNRFLFESMFHISYLSIDLEIFFTNPQYLINVMKSDVESGDGLCTIICACLQKYTRQKRQETGVQQAEEYINLRLYRVCIIDQIDSITKETRKTNL